jgi:Flp pilus assembly protein TadB
MKSPIQFKIAELRQRSMLRTTEAILVVFAAIIAIAVLPTLLLRYLYDPTQLLEQPKLLEYIPVVSIVIATIYLLRALLGNMKREKEVKSLVMEMEMMDDGCCGSGKCGGHSEDSMEDEDWDEDLKELEELLAEVEAEEAAEGTKKSSKKKAAPKKSTKKSSKK